MEAVSVDPQSQQSLENFATCRQHEGWTRQQLLDYQAEALQSCREYAYAHSSFYRRFHQGLMDRPLQELPVLTKGILMEHFDDLVTDPAVRLDDVRQYLDRADAGKLFLDRYRIVATSGSTGQPGIFIYSRTEGAIIANSFSRFQHWCGITPESRAAVVASTAPAHMTSQFPIIIDGQPVPRIQLASNDSLENLVQRLNDWQPDAFFAYPSIASILANEQRQGRLHIAPRSVICSAEALLPEMRQRIEETWQTRLFNVYGMTEAGVLASECPSHQGFHIFEDFSIIEVVDQNNRPVAPGTSGSKVLLTVLFRRTQPLIRYEVPDPVRFSASESCPCGSPLALLEIIEGRTAEMLYLLSDEGKEQGVSPLQFQTVFDTLPIGGWQIVQEADGLHIFLAGASEQLRDDDVVDTLRQMLTRRGVVVPPLQLQRVAGSALIRNAGGKAPMLISHVSRQVD